MALSMSPCPLRSSVKPSVARRGAVARAGVRDGSAALRLEVKQAQQAAAALAAAALVMATGAPVLAEDGSGMFAGMTDAQRSKLDAAEQQFQQSETLRMLKERSEANRAKNKKAIENKYCYRQAELGVGDCGGLRLIPGMTDSGKQQTPDWLAKVLGMTEEQQAAQQSAGGGKTIKDLLGPDPR